MTPTETIEMIRAQLREEDFFLQGVSYDKFHDRYEIVMSDEELTFDMLQKLSTALNTRNINVVSDCHEGYYGEVSKYLRLEVKFTGERTNG